MEPFEETLQEKLNEAQPSGEQNDPKPSGAPSGRKPESQGMIIAALFIGGICLVGMMCVLPALFLAPVGIAVALLSRGANEKMDPRARIGLCLSVAGFVLSIAMTVSSFMVLKNSPEMKKEYRQTMEMFYGEDFEEQLPGFFQDLLKE